MYWNSSARNWSYPGSIHLIKSWEIGTIAQMTKEHFVARCVCVLVNVRRYSEQTPTMEECSVVRNSSVCVLVKVRRYLEL